MQIFKIIDAAEWAAASGSYEGSDKDRADGFMHFSTAEQLPGTLARYYAGMRGFVLVAVDEATLGAALKYEPSRDGALFPHLYAPLSISAVLWVRPIEYDEARGHILPL